MKNRSKLSFISSGMRRSCCVSPRLWRVLLFQAAFFALLILWAPMVSLAAPPPNPSQQSTLGEVVTNPLTGKTTTVSALIADPTGTPTEGTTAFVQTSDGYTFMVKAVNGTLYTGGSPPVAFTIQSIDTTSLTASLVPVVPDPVTGSKTQTMVYEVDTNANTTAATQMNDFLNPPSNTPGTPGTVPTVIGGPGGVQIIGEGEGGDNGRAGALFVPPSSGYNGQSGPTVNYTNTINISTTNKIGIEAGSIGGKGGNGGNSYASFWSGRDGGNGGAGGDVTVTNNAGVQVATTGNNMYGIFAYSRGGQAGNGGSGYAAPGGGTGGHSSNGGDVTVTNNGIVITSGVNAYGIYGLSVSNNGGNGGSQWGFVGKSGSGGYGGSGGTVTITNSSTGSIQTSGGYASGIVAQSIGGSGGSSGVSGNLLLSLNGAPDNGGNGGQVTVTNNGSISTTGDYALGIFAESVGGGGGSGGGSYGLLAFGGCGSNGGSAGTVEVTNTGTISTGKVTTDSGGNTAITGEGSYGIFAQSVGGSGGNGSNAGGLFALGGRGAKAGNGGKAEVYNYGNISTQANKALGIEAQSVGGGGGDGGNSGGMVSVGGNGAGGGTGAEVDVTNGGDITTNGADARGILAQSVGGGGGNGGSSGSVGAFVGVAVGGAGGGGGYGGPVNVTLQGKDADTASVIHTKGDRSTGLFAQSVGGGGGTGGGAVQVAVGVGAAVSVAVGGSGGKGGAGGIVTMSNGTGTSDVETDGNDAAGVFMQSVGGGGGSGGYAVSVAASGGPVGGSLSVGVGGGGATGGAGGEVLVGTVDTTPATTVGPGLVSVTDVGFNGNILTEGDRSTGFVVQSVGGGGGNGGLAVAASLSASLAFSGSIGVSVGGTGSGGGVGGLVSAGIQGNITTEGADSIGLLAQSVGGGGGNGGGAIAAGLSASGGGAGTVTVGVGGDAGTASNGGQVTLATRSGTITTQGDNSTGILVESVGGGGGNGGYSVSAGLSGAGVGAGAINVGVGGTGGGGGNGGAVYADLQSDVTTSSVLIPQSMAPLTGKIIPAHFGENSPGIVVQSVGGGGGNGGFNVSAGVAGAGTGSGAVTVGLGGSGAAGGTGGAVEASSTGKIATQGDSSPGFVAQSVGGGGGNGGFNVSAGLAGAGVASGAVAVGLGGNAGAGDDGGTVTASTSVGKVTTMGNSSAGIIAQSLGGGGGNGGFNVSGVGSGAGTGSGAIAVGLGGRGGAGANGGDVTLTVHNDVSTGGDKSSAVVAQSIGGGGGNGGFNVSGAASGAGTGSGSIAVGLGGNGAGGGNGGIVNSSITGNFTTLLDNSAGIVAQSVGGGGGNGGFNVSAGLSGAGVGSGAVSVGLGGNGGAAGNGGPNGLGIASYAVTLQAGGTVATEGDSSAGIVAQSVGGGGGNGGFNISAGLSGAGTGSGAVSVGLGGSGGSGGNGMNVFADLNSDVTTSSVLIAQSVDPATGAIIPAHYGEYSPGIVVQSVGGGGGNGGFNVTVGASGAGTGSGAVSVGLGGSGGAGGNGGNVSLTMQNDVSTFGTDCSAVTAQSIGGGGGNGGFNVSSALSGAGTGSGSISVGLGGSGKGGGNGGVVNSSITGDITTALKNSTGILAQSVGGGGGSGGFDVSAALSGAGKGSGSISVGLGGSGGGGGNGGPNGLSIASYAVTLQTGGTVVTQGDSSSGIVAQSIGGGGGNGGFDVSAALSGAGQYSGAVSVGLGGTGGTGGTGMNVLAQMHSDVTTSSVLIAQSVDPANGTIIPAHFGKDSPGIVVQSIGGGGGNGGFNISAGLSGAGKYSAGVSVSLGGSGGNGGPAGNVDASSTGTIVTRGDQSSAYVVQSIGGGGGNGGFNVSGSFSWAGKKSAGVSVGIGGNGGTGNYAGEVTARSSGDIRTYGDQSAGIVAQSVGGGGGNGGFSGALAIGGTGSATVAVGGSGGKGGVAGAVTLTSSSKVQTGGNDSQAILAQSIGGGGGNGAFAATLSISTGSPTPILSNVSLSIGGNGGTGGESKSVTLNSTGATIQTSGDGSIGLQAQSIGGGGGNGGISLSFAAGQDAFAFSDIPGLNLGSKGGGGGNAVGTVTLNDSSNVTTSGDFAAGILAQSIGGGGGAGGTKITGALSINKSGVGLSLGASGTNGSGGGNASDVTVTDTLASGASTKTIRTSGLSSSGIGAQSVGGGGGVGGFGFSLGVKTRSSYVPAMGLGFGGSGGAGGYAGNVTVSGASDIITSGDDSFGILAQSVGGGGGDGGVSLGISASTQGSKGLNIGGISLAMGGKGGTGSHAGEVDVTSSGEKITTNGNSSSGVLAQSLGGGGGNGGGSVALTASLSLKMTLGGSVAIGGAGGSGGYAGGVDVTNSSIISTGLTDGNGGFVSGNDSKGIYAQSVGGGGGNGGFSVAADVNLSGVGVSVGLGGNGGNGNKAGGVAVTSTGASITTLGNDSEGILAQSVGGGGGNGGFSIAAGLSGISQLSFAWGGKGGSGADAGIIPTGKLPSGCTGAACNSNNISVYIGNSSKISTGFLDSGGSVHGNDSPGIMAESIGGGGGNGGFSISAGVSTVGGLSLGFGGTGGMAGEGYDIIVNNAGPSITTLGDRSEGIIAQSIGGGGGNGGFSIAGSLTAGLPLALSFGGSGKGGGTGGAVSVMSSGDIGTSGQESSGIFAQSIGGGGGNGGFSIAGSLTAGLPLALSIGGSGKGGGAGGAVSVMSSGDIGTSGQESSGIFAQSIGGGGGNGGFSALGAVGILPGISFALGGTGGVGGDGGNIIVTNSGVISTSGILSCGIFAQSIGGGGGNGGGAYSGTLGGLSVSIGGNGGGASTGGSVAVTNSGRIETDGVSSQAIFAQSVGGGGGNGGIAGSSNLISSISDTVTIGGTGATGGSNGGAVSVTNKGSGSIVTNGVNSTAIFAQSIGGGGGNGGGYLSSAAGSGSATITLGGNGGSGGNGAKVTVTNEGTIQINANNSIGIMAQSVGGGGGAAGSALGPANVAVHIGGQNGASGTGGNVSVVNTGSIYIAGSNSIGIFAQSVGGGGGIVSPGGGAGSLTLESGGSGNGGTVTINNSAGSIVVTGANSIAMYTQSVGGGGGAVGLSSDPPGQVGAFLFTGASGGTGTAEATTVNQTGSLFAPGSNSIALGLESSGATNGSITGNILNGTTPSLIVGGSGQGAGVYIKNGTDNTLNNNGTVSTATSITDAVPVSIFTPAVPPLSLTSQEAYGSAIIGGAGNDRINNIGLSGSFVSGINNGYGYIIGSVDLGAGSNSFDNGQNAVFMSGPSVYLGVGNRLSNEGWLLPGGWNRVLTSSVTGSFTQSATGFYGVDLDLKNSIADRINVTGSASLSGTIAINLIDPASYAAYALPGLHDYVLVSTGGALTHDALRLVAPDTAVSTFWLSYPEDPSIDLNHSVDYSPYGLTPNQHSTGDAINRIQLAQVPTFRSIAAALFFQPTVAGLGAIYDSLSGEGVSAAEQTGFEANDLFLSSIAHRTAYWISNDPNDPVGKALRGDKDLLYARQTSEDPASGGIGVPPEANRTWRMWMSGYGGVSSYNGDAGAGSVQADLNGAGFAMGIDDQISENTLVGIAGGCGDFSFDVPGRQTSGDVTPWHIAGYAAKRYGCFYAIGALAFDHFDNDESRGASTFIPGATITTYSNYYTNGTSTTIPGVGQDPTGKFDAYSVSGYFEAGYNDRINQLTVTPFAALEFGVLHTYGFADSGDLGLSYAARTVSSLPTQLGLQLKDDITLARGYVLTTLVRAAWMHELEPERSIAASFLAAPGFDFEVQGAQPPIDSLRSGVGFSLSVGRDCSLYVNFDSDYSGVGHSYSGTGGFSYTW